MIQILKWSEAPYLVDPTPELVPAVFVQASRAVPVARLAQSAATPIHRLADQ
jgi:hypothetical protein